MLLRNALPDHHLAEDSKDVVRLGTGLIATIAALVLGLLIASAKSSFDTQTGQVRHMTANVILLDQLLDQYGPEAMQSRELLRRAIDPMVEEIWRKHSLASAKAAPFAPNVQIKAAIDSIPALSPQNNAQRSLKSQAV
jgi:hypothetical protein